MSQSTELPEFARHLVNLASPRLGGQVLEASDDFFAPKERLLQDIEPVFIADKFDDHGKWMDGWESRRRRGGGHDHVVVRLGARGTVRGVDMDTRYFTGNYPPQASLEAADGAADTPVSELKWREILGPMDLGPDRHHYQAISDDGPVSHLRLNIFPDGGVARLRVYGEPLADWSRFDRDALVELSAIANGGRIAGFNDAHYGDPWVILISGRGINMGDGWETRRRREPGHDWILVRLGAPGAIEQVEIDTAHFKGNYPDQCSIQGALIDNLDDRALAAQAQQWPELMLPTQLEMDHQHFFERPSLEDIGPVNCLRLNIFPDGGVSRFRAFGRPQR
ncbi:MAG: allantoicase [Acidiferrobacteraceae bacterium]|jgi:allantoicase|nr:allantoicase [Acidiferrobacteraceae bacterium]MCP4829839.1 allantoicase [Pseudomonadota bacterium]MDP6950244.1 allantoicase [Arenicellales bacterium]HJP05954.1 allantoicase [Arenicellales bacterium]|tara:strand:+ start:7372 stop:8379 length:1008 start_codon:yes stop_codon:yes gene_type:complete